MCTVGLPWDPWAALLFLPPWLAAGVVDSCIPAVFPTPCGGEEAGGSGRETPYSGPRGPGQTVCVLGCLELIQKPGFGLGEKNSPKAHFIPLHKPRECD